MKMWNAVSSVTYRTIAVLLCGGMLSTGLGCNAKPSIELPPTYPVRGTVVRKSGEMVSKGAVQFRSLADTNVSALGELQSDGTFTLQTMFGSELVPGAVEGQHEVTVIPVVEGNHGRNSVLLPQPQVVEPRENDLKLTIP